MDNRWFREDRKLPKNDQAKAIEQTKKALKSSTLMSRLLKGICEDEIERTYRVEEDINNPHYERAVIAAASRRKAFKDVMRLIEIG